MRKIKFRAWDRKAKKMITDEKDLLFVVGCDGSVMRSKTDGPDITGEYDWHCESMETDELLVMQFTGLHDKNGKEIYEGDIVAEKETYSPGRKAVIRFQDAKFILDYATPGILNQSLGSFQRSDIKTEWNLCEVIGNVHENPELVKA